jgi:hypothetical protein
MAVLGAVSLLVVGSNESQTFRHQGTQRPHLGSFAVKMDRRLFLFLGPVVEEIDYYSTRVQYHRLQAFGGHLDGGPQAR